METNDRSISKEMLLNLYERFDALGESLEPSKMEYFDNIDEVQRNLGRLAMMIASFDDIEDYAIGEWFDVATESYEHILFTQTANQLDPID